MVRMANLSVICSHVVNGVAFIHSELIKETLFKGFFELYPKKFQNKTNGVTPRRWIKSSNPELATIYDEYLKDEE
jgi:glycogen phosphorylase